jgi:bifunctional non-homologous end joining protein LigD
MATRRRQSTPTIAGVAHCRYLRHSGTSRPPSQVRIVNIREQTKIGGYMVVDNAAGLIALAQRNILECHTWNSTTRRLETPNRIVLDLDPGPSVPWRVVVDAARRERQFLCPCLSPGTSSPRVSGLNVGLPYRSQACARFARRLGRLLRDAAASASVTGFSVGRIRPRREKEDRVGSAKT